MTEISKLNTFPLNKSGRNNKAYTMLCLVIFLSIFLLSSFTFKASAESSTDLARKTLALCIDEVMSLLKDSAFTNPSTRPAQIEKIKAKIATAFNFSEFSARSVGPQWNSFSPEVKQEFTVVFTKLLQATYVDKLDGYTGRGVTYVGEDIGSKGDKIEVKTFVDLNNKSIPVNYRMLLSNGQWMVYDVIIEGVSLVQNYRNQFTEILQKSNPQELIGRIEKLTEERLNTPHS